MAAALLARLQDDLTTSRKAQDKPRVLLLGTILADARNREIELKRDLTDDDVVEVLRRGIKKRRESVEMYDKGGRADLAATERAELDLLSKYLPAAIDDAEIRTAVVAAIEGGAANVGAVMGKVMGRFKGRAEGSVINAIVREELAARASRTG
jgi:uncharacterized protein YqeY